MADGNAQELQRLLADEFGRQGWDYDLSVGPNLVKEIDAAGKVDPDRLAETIPSTFLQKNDATRQAVAAAIRNAVGGNTLIAESPTIMTLVVHGNNYSLTLGEGATIGGHVNVVGTQIVVEESAPKQHVLDAIAALIRAGLTDGLNGDAARALGDAIAARDDIDMVDIERTTLNVVKADAPPVERVRTLLASLGTQAVAGALGLGMASGIGQALPYLGHLV
jgi:hypothetical protein